MKKQSFMACDSQVQRSCLQMLPWNETPDETAAGTEKYREPFAPLLPGSGEVADPTAVDDVYVSFYLHINSLPTADVRIALISNAGTTVGNIVLRTTGTLRLRNGTTAIGADSAPLPAGTLYRVGLRQKKGTGGNAILEGYLAAGGASFGAPFASTTGGTWTTQADRFRFGATASTVLDAAFDDIRLDAGAMPRP